MTCDVVFCFADQEVTDATELMRDHKIRRRPVLNRQRRLVGIISIGDIALGTGNSKLVGVAVQEISTPDAPKPLPGQKRELMADYFDCGVAYHNDGGTNYFLRVSSL